MIKFSLISIVIASILISINERNTSNSQKRITNGSLIKTEKVYLDSIESVVIGDQEWMSTNLNVVKFRNGDSILRAETAEEWKKVGENGEPAWCYYDNDSVNGEKYGKLYNWYAVNDPRGLAPVGWHIPSDAEWTALKDYLGGKYVAGIKMKSTTGWKDDGNGTNESGFSGLPGGSRVKDGLLFLHIRENGYWWSSTENSPGFTWIRYLFYLNESVSRYYLEMENGFSVRCLRD